VIAVASTITAFLPLVKKSKTKKIIAISTGMADIGTYSSAVVTRTVVGPWKDAQTLLTGPHQILSTNSKLASLQHTLSARMLSAPSSPSTIVPTHHRVSCSCPLVRASSILARASRVRECPASSDRC
jgi:hypothetical protein